MYAAGTGYGFDSDEATRLRARKQELVAMGCPVAQLDGLMGALPFADLLAIAMWGSDPTENKMRYVRWRPDEHAHVAARAAARGARAQRDCARRASTARARGERDAA